MAPRRTKGPRAAGGPGLAAAAAAAASESRYYRDCDWYCSRSVTIRAASRRLEVSATSMPGSTVLKLCRARRA